MKRIGAWSGTVAKAAATGLNDLIFFDRHYASNRDKRVIVTIDGPAGSGKSSAARTLSMRLGFRFLDTGGMYRAVAWVAMQQGISWDAADRLESLARDLNIDLRDNRTFLYGQDVTDSIRHSEVTAVVKHIADHAGIRRHLIGFQRELAAGCDVVTEGRDQGTIAFPRAECKIFLTASVEERARRRFGELCARGENISFEEVLRRQNERDHRDRTREFGRLEPAVDAIHVSTDDMRPEEVIEKLEKLVRERMG